MSSSLHHTWAVRKAAGEPIAIVRIRNLQMTLPAPSTDLSSGPYALDAWARAGRAQPLLVSIEVGLTEPFPEASAGDRVANDTVHYGMLSKAVLQSVEALEKQPTSGAASVLGLRGVLDAIWSDLTGLHLGSQQKMQTRAPVLDVSRIQLLSVTVQLPKASLVGEGVSLTATATGLGSSAFPSKTAVALRLHRIRVPTLIGVHPHERTAKQAVVADVMVDRYDVREDTYMALESLIIQALDTTAYETLEALATHIAKNILAESGNASSAGWQVQVALEKPIAVPFADAPVVEVRIGSSSTSDSAKSGK